MRAFEAQMVRFRMDFPMMWTFLGSPEEAANIPDSHKDQIHFLNDEGTRILNSYLKSTAMDIHQPYSPLQDYFRSIEEPGPARASNQKLKKWLYQRGIPFSRYVFVSQDRSGHALLLTWKMVIKYLEGLFFAEDIVIFDSTLEWGLFYYHDDRMYFGKEVCFDPKIEEEKWIEVNKLISKLR